MAAVNILPAHPGIRSLLDSRRNNFDFLRLAAAFAVIFSHYYALRDGSNDREPYEVLSGYCNLGKVAVYTYFIISGVLVANSFLRDPSPRRYVQKRTLRIFPALVVCVAFCVLAVGPIFTNLSFRSYLLNKETLKFAANAVLYPNHYTLPGVFAQFPADDPRAAVNGSLWSIPPGFLMYLLLLGLGVTRLLGSKTWMILLTLAMLLGWTAYASIGIPPASHLYKYRVWIEFLPHLCFFFLCGVLMTLYGKPAWLDIRLFLACLILIAAGWWTRPPVGYFLLTVCLPYIVIYLGFVQLPRIGPAIQSINRFGDFSYGVYLYGYPVQQIFMRALGAKLSAAEHILIAGVASLLLAMLSWHLIEKRLFRRGLRG